LNVRQDLYWLLCEEHWADQADQQTDQADRVVLSVLSGGSADGSGGSADGSGFLIRRLDQRKTGGVNCRAAAKHDAKNLR
jgi:hypothetical protein